MRIRIAPRVGSSGGGSGEVDVDGLPTSKSHAQRALCLAAFLPGGFQVRSAPDSRDLQVLRRALAVVNPAGDVSSGESESIHFADNGTALRMLAVLLPMLGKRVEIDAGPRLRERPLDAAEEFLARYGATCTNEWPRTLSGPASGPVAEVADADPGPRWPTELVVDASLTTQVASGVLLGAAIQLAGDAVPRTVRILRPAAHRYVSITITVLRWFGFAVRSRFDGGDLSVELTAWSAPPEGHAVVIPVDASSYTFYAAYLAIHSIASLDAIAAGVPADDPHPDWGFVDDLRVLWGTDRSAPVEIADVGLRPDTFPCMAAVAALREGPTILRGAPALRHKESDRIAAMAQALSALGVQCRELDDGLEVQGGLGGGASDRAIVVPTPDDHRIVMATALLGTVRAGGVEIENPEAADKSWPGFFDWLGAVSDVAPVES